MNAFLVIGLITLGVALFFVALKYIAGQFGADRK